MAYKVELTLNCAVSLCQKSAKYEVRDRWNAPIGKYCPRHADEKVRTLNGYEKKEAHADR